MPLWTWTGTHRVLVMGASLCVVLAAVAAGVWYFVLRSPGTPLDLRQALRLYRTASGPGGEVPPGSSSLLPQPGVYRYRTSGGEQLSFGGIARSFPADTEMIVTDRRCAEVSWEPLRQHVEGMVLCEDHGAVALSSATTYEQIAGSSSTTVIDCPTGTFLVPSPPTPGRHWATVCWSGRQRVTLSGRVIGNGTVTVGSTTVPVVHTRVTMGFTGPETGNNPADYWIAADGLILRQRETVDLRQRVGPLGSVHYTEQMAVSLESLVPAR